jgi:DNA-binding transcriptional ArsR family regulator
MLHMIAERPHTPTELARRLGVSDTTAREHLDVLRKSRLVVRREDGRVWAYHTLTDDGRALLRATLGPPTRGALAALALAGLGSSLLARWNALRPPPPPPGSLPMPMAPDPSLPWLLGGAASALVATLLLGTTCVVAVWNIRRLRRAAH